MTENRRAVSVTELNEYIKDRLDSDALLRDVLVRGEISNFRPNTSGHVYFSLKDEGAALRCVMFKGYAGKLRFRLENGMKVVACGSVSSFVRDGQYQLYATELIADGVGDLFLAFEQLKEKLHREGLFDPARKKPLPRIPKKIALVTSPTGAAVRDMLRILKKRWPAAKVLVVPAKVQGEGAAREIAAGIALVNDKKAADLIIAGRGGGSIEDLWCFNEEIVARAIAASRIPVISAVGHEPDVTIADFAADLRAATPSNAAELAVPDWVTVDAYLAEFAVKLRGSALQRIELGQKRLDAAASKKVLTSPMTYVDEKRLALDYTVRRLEMASGKICARASERLAKNAAFLDAVSPLRVLSRGYSIVTDTGGKTLASAKALSKGEDIRIKFSEGSALCAVKEIENG